MWRGIRVEKCTWETFDRGLGQVQCNIRSVHLHASREVVSKVSGNWEEVTYRRASPSLISIHNWLKAFRGHPLWYQVLNVMCMRLRDLGASVVQSKGHHMTQEHKVDLFSVRMREFARLAWGTTVSILKKTAVCDSSSYRRGLGNLGIWNLEEEVFNGRFV